MDTAPPCASVTGVTGAVITPELFLWSGGGVVLLGEPSAERWVVARGWRQGDELTDIRRWSFNTPRAFAGQIRRLCREATGDRALATRLGETVLAWVIMTRPQS